MKKVISLILIGLAAGIVTLGVRSGLSHSKQLSQSPSDAVTAYLSASLSSDSDEIRLLTVMFPASYATEPEQVNESQPEPEGEGFPRVVDDHPAPKSEPPKTPKEFFYRWVSKEFPDLIHASGLKLKSVTSEKVAGNLAKVEVELTNETFRGMPWAFWLTRNEQGKWQVFQITTLEKAEGFPSER